MTSIIKNKKKRFQVPFAQFGPGLKGKRKQNTNLARILIKKIFAFKFFADLSKFRSCYSNLESHL